MTDDTENNAEEKCPICGEAGSVVEGSFECEHHIGTYDCFMGSQPIDYLTDDSEFDLFRDFLNDFEDWSSKKKATFRKKLPPNLDVFLDTAANNNIDLFWMDLVNEEMECADITESHFETTYYALFVKNPSQVRRELLEKVSSILKFSKLPEIPDP